MSKRPPAVLWFAVFAVCIAVLLAGCSPGPIDLTQKDSGSAQTLAKGQEMRVTLESNHTTGYQWAVDGDLPEQLTLVGQPEYKAESNLVGAGGTEVWTFMGKSSGEGTLKLKYWRSFEPTAEPADTFEVSVKVE